MLPLVLAGCTFVTDAEWEKRLAACDQSGLFVDADGDGWGGEAASGCYADPAWVDAEGDCDDASPDVHPGAADEAYDGVDADCEGGDDYDADGDGHASAAYGGDDCYDIDTDEVPALAGDCDVPGLAPDPASVHPGAQDAAYDGLDADCSGGTDYDVDGDGFPRCEECNDEDATVYPNESIEVWYDGIDANCDGNDGDKDGDGYYAADYPGSVPADFQPGDCWDDADTLPADFTALDGFPQLAAAYVHPGVDDDPYDGVDAACDGGTDFDADGDTFDTSEWPNRAGATGEDCDDADAAAFPGAPETWYDGTDSDCLGDSDYDQDGDTHDAVLGGGEDCDDTDRAVNPDAIERCATPDDDDCDGNLDALDADGCTPRYEDADGDGYGGSADECRCEAGGDFTAAAPDDCDDTEAGAHPGVAGEDCATAYDDDCDGSTNAEDAPGCVDFFYDGDADGLGVETTACWCDAASPYTATAAGDCDDTDAAVLLSRTFYQDADGDGSGNASITGEACTSLSGYVTNDDDCDDTRSDVYPGATESCGTAYDEDCDGDTNDSGADACSTWYLDADADGYGIATSVCTCIASGSYTAANTDDCDDAHADASPVGSETCATDYDDDCDGDANEVGAPACSNWFADADGDGYGTDYPQCQCTAGNGYDAPAPGDCDEADATRHPYATEACDSIDNNCDGTVDEGAMSTFYTDADGDGFGATSATEVACTASAGFVANADDCNDGDAAVSPDADESCATGYDDDCNGTTNDDGAVGCSTFYADADADGYGTSDSVCLCSAAAPYTASSTSDCDDDESAAYPGATEVCGDGLDNDCDGLPGSCTLSGTSTAAALAYATLVGEEVGDSAGATVSAAGDFDGDGEDDLLVGAHYYNDGGESNVGAAYVVTGTVSGSTDLSTATLRLIGDADNDNAGRALSAAGDVDADGYADVMVGAYQNDDATSDAGAAYLVAGGTSGTVGATDSIATFLGDGASDYAGRAVAGGMDLDEDGFDDVAIGAPSEDTGGVDAGSTYLFYGPLAGTLGVASAGAQLVGEAIYDYAGWSVTSAGDVDGDGAGDILLGAYGSDTGGSLSGSAYLLYGPVTGTLDLSLADAHYVGEDASDQAGTAVAAGDLDGDGLFDLLIGAPEVSDNGSAAGAFYVMLGADTGTVSLASADAQFHGDTSKDHAGSALSVVDADGDAISDILAGAWGNDTGPGESGSAYIVYGPPSGVQNLGTADCILTGDSTNDYAGYGLAGVGDQNGDGWEDLIVGAYGDDAGGSSAGAVWVVRGGGF